MRDLSVCSGIEAASVAWEPLGWKPLAFAEIEPFPRAILAHHYPDVPLHGDFTVLRHEPWIVDADLLVGGTPCQAFSIAGLRQSLADDRGNLILEYIRLANAIDDLRRDAGRDPAWICWENVPGVLSVKDNAFGAFLAGLVGADEPIVPRGGWTASGVVSGPRRVAAWRTLDAQHFGLAQRRRRVFVLAREHPRGWACADALLPIIDSLSGHPAPRREAGQRAAAAASGGAAFGGNNTAGPIDVATALSSHGGPHGRLDFESETFVAHTLRAQAQASHRADTETYVTHSLRGEGFDASEDGTGRGTPLVPVSFRTAGDGAVYEEGDLTAPITTGTDPSAQLIAFSSKDHGADAESDLAPTLRAGTHDGSHANGGVPPAIAYSIMPQNSGKDFKARPVDVAQPLMASGPVGGDQGGDQGGDYILHPVGVTIHGTDGTARVASFTDLAGNLRTKPPGSVENSSTTAVLQPVNFAVHPITSDALRGEGSAKTPSRDASGNLSLRDPGLGIGEDGDPAGTLNASGPGAIAFALRGREGGAMPETHDHVSALRAASGGSSRDYVAFDTTQVTSTANRSNSKAGDPCHPLAAGAHPPAIAGSAVRRLTPGECEKLQGFPVGYTNIPWRGQPEAPDGPRYKSLGNSMATPVMRHIGENIVRVSAPTQSKGEGA